MNVLVEDDGDGEDEGEGGGEWVGESFALANKTS